MCRVYSLMFEAVLLLSLLLTAAAPAVANQRIAKPSTKNAALLADRPAIARADRATRVAAIPSDVACGPWCRHAFVLMLGIGF